MVTPKWTSCFYIFNPLNYLSTFRLFCSFHATSNVSQCSPDKNIANIRYRWCFTMILYRSCPWSWLFLPSTVFYAILLSQGLQFCAVCLWEGLRCSHSELGRYICWRAHQRQGDWTKTTRGEMKGVQMTGRNLAWN